MSEQDPNKEQAAESQAADSTVPSDAQAASEATESTAAAGSEAAPASDAAAPEAAAASETAAAPVAPSVETAATAVSDNQEVAAAAGATPEAAPGEHSKPKSDTGAGAGGKSMTDKPTSTTDKPTSTTGKPTSSTSKPSSTTGNGRSTPGSKAGSTTGGAGSKAGSTTGGARSSSHHHSSTSKNGAGAGNSPAQKDRHQSHRKRIKLGELNLSTARIGFLGAGKIAESTINGLIHYGKISPSRIYVAAPSSKGLERFKALGCRVTKRNYDIFGRYDCDIVFLAFHGYVIKHCYKLGNVNRPHPLCTNYIPHQRHPVYILSLVSGVSLGQIKQVLLNPENPTRYVIELHRIMVNTAVGHGLGLCAIDCEPDSKKLSAPIRQLLSSIAHLEYVPATQMDAACAIGGSGLAFAYYFINALADGAFRMGLSRAQAIRFASKTAQCAAQTMLESGKHPAELRDNVSAPSGAAIYGIHVLEKNDVASGVTAAVEAAHKRAHDLATQDVTQ